MAAKWMKSRFPGVRYREHESRKYGVKFDRYYSVRYKLNGRGKEEALGWASQGWTEQKAAERLAELKQNHRTGEGAQTLEEKRKNAEQQRQEEIKIQEKERKDNLLFADAWKEYHGDRPEGIALEDRRKQKKYDREDQLYRLWIAPVVSKMKIRLIAPVNLKRIEKNMADAGKAPRSIQYAFALIRQVYNFAKKNDLFSGDIPTSKIKWPKVDNGRTRYLTPDEANTLLQALKEKSQDTYGISLLSFQCGLRFGEVANLKWFDVDYERGLLLIRDAKAGTRHAFLTEQATEMLKNRVQGEPYDLIFQAKDGGVMNRISPSFFGVVKDLGLN
jgi:integrase